jgi:hypothetical protein
MLPGLIRRAAPIAFAAVAACRNDGELVILVDSRDANANLDIVAAPFDPAGVTGGASAGQANAPADSLARLAVLDDSAARLGAWFSTARDSLNIAVQSLDTADRRTRAYAVRFAELRRRTAAAEQIRDTRNAIQARADSLRTKLALPPRTGAPSSASAAVKSRERGNREDVQRHRVNGTTMTLTLESGTWWVGLATAGAPPAQFTRATVRSGTTDTLRLTVRGAGVITVP